tara:strand:+ start:1216 stop:1500 length:285 start_codon:yes stop_codon:yes gene_type:complete
MYMAAKKGKRPDNAPRNFVHLHGIAFNHAATHADKRKDAKMGKRKHKTAWRDNPGGFSVIKGVQPLCLFPKSLLSAFVNSMLLLNARSVVIPLR